MLRTVRIAVRYTPTEAATVRERARACGHLPARFIRETSLGATPRARAHHTLHELIHHLARIGNDITLLVATPASSVQLNATLAELRSLLRQLTTTTDEGRQP
jgi:hypothetical protein